jgi:hypothetical protein
MSYMRFTYDSCDHTMLLWTGTKKTGKISDTANLYWPILTLEQIFESRRPRQAAATPVLRCSPYPGMAELLEPASPLPLSENASGDFLLNFGMI